MLAFSDKENLKEDELDEDTMSGSDSDSASETPKTPEVNVPSLMYLLCKYINTQKPSKIPCIYCAKFFLGERGLARHEKFCIDKKNAGV